METAVQFANQAHLDYSKVTADFQEYKHQMANKITQWRDKDKSVLNIINENSKATRDKVDIIKLHTEYCQNDIIKSALCLILQK